MSEIPDISGWRSHPDFLNNPNQLAGAYPTLYDGIFVVPGYSTTTFKMEEDRGLSQNDGNVTQENMMHFRHAIRTIAEHIYPGMIDLQGAGRPGRSYNLIIRFPQLTIRNSSKKTHNIEELYVKIKFLNCSFSCDNIQGIRAKLSPTEYQSAYAHSHLPSNAIYDFGDFCLGSTTFKALATDLTVNDWRVDPENWQMLFEAFLFQLNAYLRWESLEGTPYKYMENIGTGSDEDIQISLTVVFMAKKLFLEYIASGQHYDKLEFVIDSKTGKVELLITDWMEEILSNCTSEFCYRDQLGNFYNTLKPSGSGEIDNFVPFTFQGNIVKSKLIITTQEDSRRKYASRTIVNNIKNELEKRFRRIWLEESYPVYTRRIKSTQSQWAAYSAGKVLSETFTIAETSE